MSRCCADECGCCGWNLVKLQEQLEDGGGKSVKAVGDLNYRNLTLGQEDRNNSSEGGFELLCIVKVRWLYADGVGGRALGRCNLITRGKGRNGRGLKSR